MGHHFSWRHDQVAKVEDCNSFIPSSNLGVASKQHSKVAQWWSTRLLTDRLRVRVPPLEPRCRSGGTGRRTGLKILRDLYSRTGSIPVAGIEFICIREVRDEDVDKSIVFVFFILSYTATKKSPFYPPLKGWDSL